MSRLDAYEAPESPATWADGVGKPPRRYDFVYAPFQADKNNQPWRYVIGFLGFVLIAILLQAIMGSFIAGALYALSAENDWADRYLEIIIETPQMQWPWELFLIFAFVSFASYVAALFLVLQVFHDRGLLSVVSKLGRFRINRFALGFMIYAALLVVPFVLSLPAQDDQFTYSFDPNQFILFLAILIPMLLVQTGFEELFFRGYLLQLVGAFRVRLFLVVLIPALLFTGAHLGNPEVAAAPGILLFYLSFAVFMTLLVFEEQGIELVFGAHFANNLVVSALVRPENSALQTPAIYIAPPIGSDVGGDPTLAALIPAAAPALFYGIMVILRSITGGRRRA